MSRSNTHRIQFVVDGLKLSGVLHLPTQKPSVVVVGSHGLMADKSSQKQIALAKGCVAIGMGYFRFDHRGCGKSDGVFENETTLENRCKDLKAAVQFVLQRVGRNTSIGLFGSSLGGTVCLSTAHQISPYAMVTLAAPIQSRNIQIPDDSPDSLKNEILEKRLRFDIAKNVKSINHILIIHGDADKTVPVEQAHIVYQLVMDPKKLTIIENADHRISGQSHQKKFIESTVQWFNDYRP